MFLQDFRHAHVILGSQVKNTFELTNEPDGIRLLALLRRVGSDARSGVGHVFTAQPIDFGAEALQYIILTSDPKSERMTTYIKQHRIITSDSINTPCQPSREKASRSYKIPINYPQSKSSELSRSFPESPTRSHQKHTLIPAPTASPARTVWWVACTRPTSPLPSLGSSLVRALP